MEVLGFRILFHIIVSANLDAKLKDRYKARTNASKKLYHANPILENMPQDNPEYKGRKPSGPWFGSIGTCGLGDDKVC